MKNDEKYKKQLAASLRWKKRNKEKVKEYQDKWASENKDLKLRLTREWKLKNPDALIKNRKKFSQDNPNYYKDKHLRGVYGLTLEQYDAILEFQEYRCCVCGKHESQVPRKRLYVDHCHKTTDIRGLICAHCNTALGMVKDDVEILYRLAAYLNEFK